MKNENKKWCSRNFLGMTKIDWKRDKITIIWDHLEKLGCKKNGNKETDAKKRIMKILKDCKNGKLPEINDLNIIYSNAEELDHFDLVRTDQLITIIYNSTETEYQWGSVCLNKKWKIL